MCCAEACAVLWHVLCCAVLCCAEACPVLWPQDEVSAAAVARMVDMSLEEVADLLGGAAASGPGDTDTGLLAREAAHVLLQLEAAICSGLSNAL